MRGPSSEFEEAVSGAVAGVAWGLIFSTIYNVVLYLGMSPVLIVMIAAMVDIIDMATAFTESLNLPLSSLLVRILDIYLQ